MSENYTLNTENLSIDDKQITAIDAVVEGGEVFYRLSNSDAIRPFFMSIVSDSNHWMFISSNGGLSAGRKDVENALFPYYTDDKITASAECTGSKSILQVEKDHKRYLWEPFSDRMTGVYNTTRNLYKSKYGDKILFEEINHDLDLTFRYQWNSSNSFGFVKKTSILNAGLEEVQISILDGIQNVMPYGVSSDLQTKTSNLVDAYKRSELEVKTGLGIYALSAIIVDKAEPSEALKANVVWSLGMERPVHLLSSLQLNNFRKGQALIEETDIKAEKGAYFIHEETVLFPNHSKVWKIIANVNQSHSDIAKLSRLLQEEKLDEQVEQDIALGTKNLKALIAASDGLQLSADDLRDTRHYSNVLFNIMRGGIFDDNYQIEKRDFDLYLQKANHSAFTSNQQALQQLPEVFSLSLLKEVAENSSDQDFSRLCSEYLPLKFSRRHGDPSRPWNRFSINTHDELDGSKILDYEGNWRDIFQNWEALAHSYPMFIESMIHKFLNASTFDGYNPYRITKDGFDWETIEPDDPWSYIGYWGDHQIIYLLKFLEFIEDHQPGRLAALFNQERFVLANVPYKIKSYEEICLNPKDTIDFDEDLDSRIRKQRQALGADGALLYNAYGEIHYINFIEKMLIMSLAKLSNFIPEGGIWMNTQRPEWNDANNALVGNGVSMVTLYYLRRFFKFLREITSDCGIDQVLVSSEVTAFYHAIAQTLDSHKHLLSDKISDADRKSILDGLGHAGSRYRNGIYQNSFSGQKTVLKLDELVEFVDVCLQYLEHSIVANKRSDNLYHAYNLMTIKKDSVVEISSLDEMLEGQVAVLSAGFLSSSEALSVLDALKNSALFREDQYSYLLYPNKALLGFMNKNNIPEKAVAASGLLTHLVNKGNIQIIEKDINGAYHFNGNFKNSGALLKALAELSRMEEEMVTKEDIDQVLQIFEEVFNHKAFTGRSGTFFGYEGLGSIYWHMVSKLQLAVQECCIKAINEKESKETIGRFLEHYYEINEGIGVHKPPSLYGAFSTDPYSHTPAGKGAQQPGMTGQVKEDILSRFGELGVFVEQGNLHFNPCILRKDEFLKQAQVFKYFSQKNEQRELSLEADTLCFTYCQVPIVYKLSSKDHIEVLLSDGTLKTNEGLSLGAAISRAVFERSGAIDKITVFINPVHLK